MNSILQCLSHTIPLCELICDWEIQKQRKKIEEHKKKQSLEYEDEYDDELQIIKPDTKLIKQKQEQKQNVQNQDQQVLIEFLHLIQEVWKKKPSQITKYTNSPFIPHAIIAPRKLRNALGQFDGMFIRGQPQDADQAFIAILKEIHNGIKEIDQQNVEFSIDDDQQQKDLNKDLNNEDQQNNEQQQQKYDNDSKDQIKDHIPSFKELSDLYLDKSIKDNGTSAVLRLFQGLSVSLFFKQYPKNKIDQIDINKADSKTFDEFSTLNVFPPSQTTLSINSQTQSQQQLQINPIQNHLHKITALPLPLTYFNEDQQSLQYLITKSANKEQQQISNTNITFNILYYSFPFSTQSISSNISQQSYFIIPQSSFSSSYPMCLLLRSQQLQQQSQQNDKDNIYDVQDIINVISQYIQQPKDSLLLFRARRINEEIKMKIENSEQKQNEPRIILERIDMNKYKSNMRDLMQILSESQLVCVGGADILLKDSQKLETIINEEKQNKNKQNQINSSINDNDEISSIGFVSIVGEQINNNESTQQQSLIPTLPIHVPFLISPQLLINSYHQIENEQLNNNSNTQQQQESNSNFSLGHSQGFCNCGQDLYELIWQRLRKYINFKQLYIYSIQECNNYQCQQQQEKNVNEKEKLKEDEQEDEYQENQQSDSDEDNDEGAEQKWLQILREKIIHEEMMSEEDVKKLELKLKQGNQNKNQDELNKQESTNEQQNKEQNKDLNYQSLSHSLPFPPQKFLPFQIQTIINDQRILIPCTDEEISMNPIGKSIISNYIHEQWINQQIDSQSQSSYPQFSPSPITIPSPRLQQNVISNKKNVYIPPLLSLQLILIPKMNSIVLREKVFKCTYHYSAHPTKEDIQQYNLQSNYDQNNYRQGLRIVSLEDCFKFTFQPTIIEGYKQQQQQQIDIVQVHNIIPYKLPPVLIIKLGSIMHNTLLINCLNEGFPIDGEQGIFVDYPVRRLDLREFELSYKQKIETDIKAAKQEGRTEQYRLNIDYDVDNIDDAPIYDLFAQTLYSIASHTHQYSAIVRNPVDGEWRFCLDTFCSAPIFQYDRYIDDVNNSSNNNSQKKRLTQIEKDSIVVGGSYLLFYRRRGRSGEGRVGEQQRQNNIKQRQLFGSDENEQIQRKERLERQKRVDNMRKLKQMRNQRRIQEKEEKKMKQFLNEMDNDIDNEDDDSDSVSNNNSNNNNKQSDDKDKENDNNNKEKNIQEEEEDDDDDNDESIIEESTDEEDEKEEEEEERRMLEDIKDKEILSAAFGNFSGSIWQ